MRTKSLSLLATALLFAGCQQTAPPAAPVADEAGNRWAALAALPDWSGVWEIDWRNKRGTTAPRPQMKLTPEYQARLDAYPRGAEGGREPAGRGRQLRALGLPGIMTQPYPDRIPVPARTRS